MKVYVMRHGQTVWNAIGRIQGWSKNRLSELGKAQAQEAAEKLKNVKVDVIFSSPLMRTMQTANIVNQFHKVKIIKDERLIEKQQGQFTGRFKNTLTEEEWKLRRENPKACGGETLEEIYIRTKEFLDFLKEEYRNKNVLIVTHGHSVDFLKIVLSGENVNERLKINEYNAKQAEVMQFVI